MLSHLEEILLFLSFFCLMIGIGASLEHAQLWAVWQDKRALALGLLLQYFLLPTLALLLSRALGLSPLIASTLILIAACPGGSTSNMFTYFSRGNVGLSLSLTFLTTCGAFVMTPLLFWSFTTLGSLWAGGSLAVQGDALAQTELSIPLSKLFATLAVALVPVVLGFAVRLRSVTLAQLVEKIGARIGYLSIAAMMVIWYPKLQQILREQDLRVFVAAGALSFLGILLSLLLALLLRQSVETARTLSFETGIQNAPLAFALLVFNLPHELSLQIGWVPLVYGALSVGNAMVFTVLYRLRPLWQKNVIA